MSESRELSPSNSEDQPDHSNENDQNPEDEDVPEQSPETPSLHETMIKLFREHGPSAIIRELVDLFIK